ncbi:hypothetical protein BaRGS_00012114, partial [Batillaria attramentaria]
TGGVPDNDCSGACGVKIGFLTGSQGTVRGCGVVGHVSPQGGPYKHPHVPLACRFVTNTDACQPTGGTLNTLPPAYITLSGCRPARIVCPSPSPAERLSNDLCLSLSSVCL